MTLESFYQTGPSLSLVGEPIQTYHLFPPPPGHRVLRGLGTAELWTRGCSFLSLPASRNATGMHCFLGIKGSPLVPLTACFCHWSGQGKAWCYVHLEIGAENGGQSEDGWGKEASGQERVRRYDLDSSGGICWCEFQLALEL